VAPKAFKVEAKNFEEYWLNPRSHKVKTMGSTINLSGTIDLLRWVLSGDGKVWLKAPPVPERNARVSSRPAVETREKKKGMSGDDALPA